VPLPIVMLPDEPADAEPEATLRAPLTPAVPAFALLRVTAPLLVSVPVPD
jgi:hypothetical protein